MGYPERSPVIKSLRLIIFRLIQIIRKLFIPITQLPDHITEPVPKKLKICIWPADKMNTETILLNLNYIGVAIALLISDILWLRVTMMAAGACLISYGAATHNNVVVAWNTLFVSINTFQVIRLIIERKPAKIDRDIIDLYNNVFSDMSRHEFLYFWKNGIIFQTSNGRLCTAGQTQSNLYLIISGSASVYRQGKKIAALNRGSFAAEMGFITNKPASADVNANGNVLYISWSREKINHMNSVYPGLTGKLQIILGRDLINKLQEHIPGND